MMIASAQKIFAPLIASHTPVFFKTSEIPTFQYDGHDDEDDEDEDEDEEELYYDYESVAGYDEELYYDYESVADYDDD